MAHVDESEEAAEVRPSVGLNHSAPRHANAFAVGNSYRCSGPGDCVLHCTTYQHTIDPAYLPTRLDFPGTVSLCGSKSSLEDFRVFAEDNTQFNLNLGLNTKQRRVQREFSQAPCRRFQARRSLELQAWKLHLHASCPAHGSAWAVQGACRTRCCHRLQASRTCVTSSGR